MRGVNLIMALAALAVAAPASAACPELEVGAEIAGPAKAAADARWALGPTLTFTAAAARQEAGSGPLYRQLVRAECGTVLLRTPEGAAIELTQPAGSAADLMRILAMSRDEASVVLPFMWDQGHDGLRKLALVYASSAGAKRAVQSIVVPKLRDAWSQSYVVDGYARFKQVAGARHDMAIGEDVDGSNTLIRRMLYEATHEADRYMRDAIPEYLYVHMNPDA